MPTMQFLRWRSSELVIENKLPLRVTMRQERQCEYQTRGNGITRELKHQFLETMN
ncbi:hypothetical protein E4U09_008272 [Claviceps aff. purpurea]|uniref:Uncharacterized protein n=1 Tax=Claviceps aff. purpurea TaxID=1967640 RepID=A0A9P7U354_9HYPO|nr:hypothetical protein E4U09_008272 [Claviceps aff. purpurea]